MSAYRSIVEKSRMKEFFEVLEEILEKQDYISEISDLSKLNYYKRNYLRNFRVYFENISYYARKNDIVLQSHSEKAGACRQFYLISLNSKEEKPIVAEVGIEGIQKRFGYVYKRRNTPKDNYIYLKNFLESYDDKIESYESDIKDIEKFFLDYINLSNDSLETLKQKILNNFLTVLKYSQFDKNFYSNSYTSEFGVLESFVKEKMKKGINLDDINCTIRNLFTCNERQIRERS